MANSATRLHPIEWATGTAAGTIAAWGYTHQADTRRVLDNIEQVQQIVAERTPLDWQVD